MKSTCQILSMDELIIFLVAKDRWVATTFWQVGKIRPSIEYLQQPLEFTHPDDIDIMGIAALSFIISLVRADPWILCTDSLSK